MTFGYSPQNTRKWKDRWILSSVYEYNLLVFVNVRSSSKNNHTHLPLFIDSSVLQECRNGNKDLTQEWCKVAEELLRKSGSLSSVVEIWYLSVMFSTHGDWTPANCYICFWVRLLCHKWQCVVNGVEMKGGWKGSLSEKQLVELWRWTKQLGVIEEEEN